MVKRKLNSRRGGKVYVAFVDYKKAFDTVDRDKLWETLEKLKTSSKMINMIKAIYTSVHASGGVQSFASFSHARLE